MIIRRGKINNKEKQFAAGNWGADKFVKEHTRIPNPLLPEIGKYHSKKKREKVDRDSKWHGCPFCGKILPVIKPENAAFRSRRTYRSIFELRASKCDCGAKVVKAACPACKRDTWFKHGSYKHKEGFGCGFFGNLFFRQIKK